MKGYTLYGHYRKEDAQAVAKRLKDSYQKVKIIKHDKHFDVYHTLLISNKKRRKQRSILQDFVNNWK